MSLLTAIEDKNKRIVESIRTIGIVKTSRRYNISLGECELIMKSWGGHATMSDVIESISVVFEVDANAIKSSSRRKEYYYPRCAAIYIIRNNCKDFGGNKASYPMIGRHFKRDHSSIIHAYTNAKKYIDSNPDFEALIERAILILRQAGFDL
jgi:chromosomal replication initiation ATPase DnaA